MGKDTGRECIVNIANGITAAAALACAAGTALAQQPPVQPTSLPIRVLVQQKDIGDPVPLPRVAGFTILRNNTLYASASCPDASNAKGELTCTLTCAPTSKDATLLLMPATREKADVVAGMKVPAARELTVADCKIATPQPVVLVYKTVTAQLAELQAASPDVYKAATVVANGRVQVKPFAAASADLEQLAAKPENRRAIQELGELGSAAAERPASGGLAAGKASVAGQHMADYAVGARSVLLKAQTSDAMGPKTADQLVKLSAKPVDLNKSIDNVTKTLGAKAVVNKDEARLERAAKELQRSQ
jgi:hypothetical protein